MRCWEGTSCFVFFGFSMLSTHHRSETIFCKKQITLESSRFLKGVFFYLKMSLSLSSHFLLPDSSHRFNSPKDLRLVCRRPRWSLSVACHKTDAKRVFVPTHPLIKHWVSVLRNEQTPCPIYKNARAELGRLLIYEATRDCLPTASRDISSPEKFEFFDSSKPISIVPILRAGLALAEHVSFLLPATKTYHIGISRGDETRMPTVYLNELPEKFPADSRVLVVDCVLATGRTVLAALELITERGVENKQIKVISVLATSSALQKLGEKFPGLEVYAAAYLGENTVSGKGSLVCGIGDAGDRSFGT